MCKKIINSETSKIFTKSVFVPDLPFLKVLSNVRSKNIIQFEDYTLISLFNCQLRKKNFFHELGIRIWGRRLKNKYNK